MVFLWKNLISNYQFCHKPLMLIDALSHEISNFRDELYIYIILKLNFTKNNHHHLNTEHAGINTLFTGSTNSKTWGQKHTEHAFGTLLIINVILARRRNYLCGFRSQTQVLHLLGRALVTSQSETIKLGFQDSFQWDVAINQNIC